MQFEVVLRLHLLGPMQAWNVAGDSVLPQGRKARAVLAILALADGQKMPRRQLAALLWSRMEVPQALARLRDVLHDIRKILGDTLNKVLVQDGDRLQLQSSAVWTDIYEARRTGTSGLVDDDLLTDLQALDPAFDEWLTAARTRWRLQAQQLNLLSEPAPPAQPAVAKRVRNTTVIGISPLRPVGPGIDDYLPIAITDEIGTALSRLRWTTVISNPPPPSAEGGVSNLRGSLGIDFILDGTLQRAGRRLRLSLKLLDLDQGGAVAWSARFEREDDDVFSLQDEVAEAVVAGLDPEILLIEAERVRRRPPQNMSAYDLVLRAIPAIYRLDRESFLDAGRLLDRAIVMEPDYAAAYAWLAQWHIFAHGEILLKDPGRILARASEVAERAILLDPNDARGLTIAGHVRAFLHHRVDEALSLHERALLLNPSLATAWHFSGIAHAYAGNLAEARKRLERCRRLSPRDPHAFFRDGALVIVHMLAGQYDAAITLGREVTLMHPRFTSAFKAYVAALGHAGRRDEARAVLTRLLSLEPDFSLRKMRLMAPYKRRDHLEHYLAGLRLAGLT